MGSDNVLGYHVKTETLLNGGTVDQAWNQLNDYPFGEQINNYASVSLVDRVIIFGSTTGGSPKIGVYKSGSWYSIGQLKSPRFSYGAVEQSGTVMIVGGRDTHNTEFWEVNDEVYDGQLALPQLTNYAYLNPTTFLVEKDFCI